MKIAILQCDDVLEKFQKDFGNYPQMINNLLTSVEETLEIEIFDVRRGQYPENIDDWNLFITTGSKSSVYNNEPWIQTLIGFVQKLDIARKKLVGICFGHQIIALAKGGSVEKSTKGWGIGIASNRILTQPAWMIKDSSNLELNLIVSHQDQINRLPNGAKIIAESDFCPYFMIQWDNHFLSVQGHPEWPRAYSSVLINDRRNIIPEKRVEEGLASLKKEPDDHLFAQWIIRFSRDNN